MKKKKNNKYLIILILCLSVFLYLLISNNNNNNNKNKLKSDISNSVLNAEIKELKSEIKDLKEINDINSLLTDKKSINASLIYRSMPYFHNIIIINKGKNNKVKKGYAVINKDGLIGEVINVRNNTSKVRLITNSDNNYISAKFNYKDKDYIGIIKNYNIKTNELLLENVIGDLNNNIIGLDVVTSGLSSKMPSGILIGNITKLKKDEYNLSNTIIIKISADINDLNILKVVGKDD